jgi:hypothetical protein
VVVIAPVGATTLSTLSAVIEIPSIDPEGGAVTYDYAWRINGTLVVGQSTSTLASTFTVKGDVVRVTVTPFDDEGLDGPAGEAERTIANAPPSAPVVSLNGGIGGIDAQVCSVTSPGVDPDGDAITYAFAFAIDAIAYDGPVATTVLSGDTLPALSTAPGDVVQCIARADDGTDLSEPASDIVTLSAPEFLDYGHIQFPCAFTSDGVTTTTVYAWLYEGGVTTGVGQGAGLTVELGVGDDGTDPASHLSWTFVTAVYNEDKDGLSPGDLANDEYMADLPIPGTSGEYDYAYRARVHGGPWTYIDLGGSDCGGNGSGDGYSPTNAGALTVSP